MKITDVKITTLKDAGNCLALASITLESEFVVTGLKVMSGNNGPFVSMPSKKNKNDEYKDICFPITKEFRQEIQTAVLDKYENDVPF